jgi:hypothetical protein
MQAKAIKPVIHHTDSTGTTCIYCSISFDRIYAPDKDIVIAPGFATLAEYDPKADKTARRCCS